MTKIYLLEDPSGITAEMLDRAISMLPDWRREQALVKKNHIDRVNTAFSYLMLRALIKECFGIDIVWAFLIGKNGKPYLAEQSGIFFSISHCRTVIAVAVSDCEIGLDAVDYRDISPHAAQRFCTEKELSVPFDNRRMNELWCRKEAYSKMTGQGFSVGFRSIEAAALDCFTIHCEDYFISVCSTGKTLYAVEKISPSLLIE